MYFVRVRALAHEFLPMLLVLTHLSSVNTHTVTSSPGFERAGLLEVLRLEEELPAGAAVQVPAGDDRRAVHVRLNPPLGRQHRLQTETVHVVGRTEVTVLIVCTAENVRSPTAGGLYCTECTDGRPTILGLPRRVLRQPADYTRDVGGRQGAAALKKKKLFGRPRLLVDVRMHSMPEIR